MSDRAPCVCGAPLSIGAAAEHLGVTVEALRYYEAKRLVHPARDDAGRRVYSAGDLDALHVVLAMRRVGFGIGKIRSLIQVKSDAPPAELVARARERIESFRDELTVRRASLDEADALLDRWLDDLRSTGF